MALELHRLIDLGSQLLDWEPATVAGQERMAADLRLLAELEQLTAAADRWSPGSAAATLRSRR